MITRLLHGLTDSATGKRGKFVTIIVWLLIAIVLVVTAPKLADIYDNGSTQDIPSNAGSQVAQRLQLDKFPGSRGTPAILVFSDEKGLSADDKATIKKVSDWLGSSQKPASVDKVLSIYTVPQAASQLVSQDNKTMTIIANMTGSSSDTQFQDSVKKMRDYLKTTTSNTSVEAHVTGPAGVITDTVLIFGAVDVKLLLATVGLVLVLLILLYRSPILAFLPLIGVGWALQIIDALLGFVGKSGAVGISQQATSIMTVLLFGAGTDYCIFIASRFREELAHTQDKHEAMRNTMRAVGEAITSSAGTVILGLMTLLFTFIGLYYSLGPALIIAIFVMLLAGLTLVPALLVWLGRAAYWPFVPKYDPTIQQQDAEGDLKGFWGRLGLWTARHRVVAVVGSTIFLIILALGNIGSVPTFNFLTSFREVTDSSTGYNILQKHFPAGTLAPTTVLVKLSGSDANAYKHLAQIDAVTVAAQKATGVAQVQGPTRPTGKGTLVDPLKLQSAIDALPAQLRDAIRSGKQPSITTQPPTGSKSTGTGQPPTTSGKPPVTGQPSTGKPPVAGQPPTNGKPPITGQPPAYTPEQLATIGAFAASTQYMSQDNSTFELSVVLKDDPYSLTAINNIAPLRDTLNKALSANFPNGNGPSATLYLAGQTSQLSDTLGYNQHDTYLVVPAVILLVGIVLALLLRSLIAPLYLLAAVTLNFLASIGICAFFFERVEGQDGFNYAIPLYTFIFLVALGADYTIFLMSRVREEAKRRGIEKGVPYAVSRTGGVITSAGLILAGTFAVLMTLPLNILFQLGACVAVGILLDTFVVRGLLVPGLVLLLGKWNWWPGRL
ncbi:MMPL family transporter [Dictyobacter kobayashii]|uniref:SSD domain-containing protein n=1 Tax=Dictyobacter kobayashii TaxID=2014872 RepID=A0A402AYK8_9CHLR|nr:MMPL family transporter [Dictyobacter kobayashii]GCE24157.1 hypothetical protein KDK_79570 [Dictyobacter kobayashii]